MFDFDQLLLHVAGIDGRDRPTHLFDTRELFASLTFQIVNLARNLPRSVKNVVVVEQISLVSKDLLYAQ